MKLELEVQNEQWFRKVGWLQLLNEGITAEFGPRRYPELVGSLMRRLRRFFMF